MSRKYNRESHRNYGGNERRKFNNQHEQLVICPYCGLPATLRDGSILWGAKFKETMVYVCTQYPECDAYVGVHKGTKTPYGTMANGELRYNRKMAHKFFDKLWESGIMKRQTAYKKLTQVLGIETSQCHVGLFNVAQCKKTVEVAVELMKLHGNGGGVKLE